MYCIYNINIKCNAPFRNKTLFCKEYHYSLKINIFLFKAFIALERNGRKIHIDDVILKLQVYTRIMSQSQLCQYGMLKHDNYANKELTFVEMRIQTLQEK